MINSLSIEAHLEPCRNCKKTDDQSVVSVNNKWVVYCSFCHTASKPNNTIIEAIRNWNIENK